MRIIVLRRQAPYGRNVPVLGCPLQKNEPRRRVITPDTLNVAFVAAAVEHIHVLLQEGIVGVITLAASDHADFLGPPISFLRLVRRIKRNGSGGPEPQS